MFNHISGSALQPPVCGHQHRNILPSPRDHDLLSFGHSFNQRGKSVLGLEKPDAAHASSFFKQAS
jgi:hypothetical protein